MPTAQIIKKSGQQAFNQPNRAKQQSDARAFKAEKQKQGKFITPAGSTTVVPSTDTAPNPNLLSSNFQEQALASQQNIRAQAPQASQQPVSQITPVSEVQAQQPVSPVSPEILAQIQRDDELLRTGKVRPFGNTAQEEAANLIAIGSQGLIGTAVGTFAGIGIKAASEAKVASQTIQQIATSKGIKLDLFDGALQKYRLKTDAELMTQIKLLSPNKLSQYLTKAKQLGTNLNPKTWGLYTQITAGLGIAGSTSTLIWKYVSERGKDIKPAIRNEFESRANTARAEQDYAFSDELILMEKDALQAIDTIKEDYSGLSGVFPTIFGGLSEKISDKYYNPKTGIIASLADKDLEFNERLRTGKTPKQFFQRLADDRKSDLDNIDLETKKIIQEIQAEKIGAEGQDYNELSKAENLADANGAERKRLLGLEYDDLKRKYLALTVKEQAELIKEYKKLGSS